MGRIPLRFSLYYFLLLKALLTTSSPITDKKSLTVLYNSKNSEDGFYQESLLRGAFLGLMEADSESNLEPAFVDLSVKNVSGEMTTILKSKTILSLLSPSEFDGLYRQLSEIIHRQLVAKNSEPTDDNFVLHLFTPRLVRATSFNDSRLRVMSLQPTDAARAAAMLHRIAKVQIQVLTPILDDYSQLVLLDIYQNLARSSHQIKFNRPIFLSELDEFELNSTHVHSVSNSYSNSTTNVGILLLSNKWRPEAKHGFWQDHHYFKWFSHYPAQEAKSGYETLFGMYTLQYVGSTKWDTPLRRNVIRDIGNFSDPSPNVISMLLAFDSATVASSYAKTGKMVQTLTGLSGKIEFADNGFRSGEANFLGISALSPNSSPYALLLQNSSWILEDTVQIRIQSENSTYIVTNYSVATSSVLSSLGLLQLAKEDLIGEKKSCENLELELIAHDPYNQQAYTYFFNPKKIQPTLIVPNQFGYGFKYLCKTNADTDVILEIACTSVANSVTTSVHCYNSRPRFRQKRESSYRKFPNSFYNRDDSSTNLLNNIPPAPSDSSSAVYMNNLSTEGADSATTTEEATTEVAGVVPETPKPPNLRGILRGVLPFVGACVGAATGCSVCVLVLGRLPLGALPAVCSGPCFVTTFANCGGLLGRTFAETTVICTELFRQGRLDLETFLADAEYGSRLALESESILKVYQKLASPIVSAMRSSEAVASAVEFVAKPWTSYMLYLMGRSSNFSWLGFVLHNLGMSTCSVWVTIGTLLEYVFKCIVTLMLSGILLFILYLQKQQS